MSKLTDMHGDFTEFVVTKSYNPAFYIRDDRLTLKHDYDDLMARFYNHRTKSYHQTFIDNIKPYVADIKQFDLVDVRDDYGWRSEQYQFLADLAEIHPDDEDPIVAMRWGLVFRFAEMRKQEPKQEVKATINGAEIELSEQMIELILEHEL